MSKKYLKNPLRFHLYLYTIILIQISLYNRILSDINCYERCKTCYESGNAENHYCSECDTASNYYFLENTPYQCYTREEVKEKGSYYLNVGTNRFERCHEACHNCSDGNTPTDLNNRCFFCKEGYFKKDNANSYNCYLPYNIENLLYRLYNNSFSF